MAEGGVCWMKTHRFAEALDAVHDPEGLAQVRVPGVLQGVEPATKRAACSSTRRLHTQR